MTQYTRANAEALLSVVTSQPNCHWLPIPSEPDSASPSPIYINDEGIFPNVTAEAELRWKPCHELPDGPDAQDRAAQPALPFPFTANELAAWMLNGVGALVASAFGNLVEREPVEGEPVGQPTVLGPDFSVLTDPDANKAREAIQAAFDIYRETVAQLKPEPKHSPKEDVISRDEMRNEALVNHGLKTPQGAVTQGLGYRAAAEKIRLVRADVREAYQTAMVRRAVRGPDALHAEWLSGMTQRLLEPIATQDKVQQMETVGAENVGLEIAAHGHELPVSRAEMIRRHQDRWQNIESCIDNAAANGLATAAKAPSGRGWIESRAMNWASSRGFLADERSPPHALFTAMRNLSALPSRTHRAD